MTINQKVVVEVVHLTSQHQSLAKAEVLTPLREDLNVPTAEKFTKEMFAQLDLSVLDATEEDILRQCAIHPRDPYVHLLNIRLCKKFEPKIPQHW